MQISDHARILALANLKQGKKPKEVAEEVNISYSQALKLSKQLVEAERRDAVLDLFDVEEAVLHQVLEAVKSNSSIAELIPQDVLEGEVEQLSKGLKGLSALETEMQNTAATLVGRINLVAATTTNADTISILAESLSKLNTSFFAKGSNVQVNNFNSGDFEKYLRD